MARNPQPGADEGAAAGRRARPNEAPADRFRELADEGAALAATKAGRQFLTYLVSSALPQGAGVYARVDGQRYAFPGALGLAPHWLDRPLDEVAQRWVSAAILARTNYFGRRVTISMRHPGSGFAALVADADERAEFTLFEGDFFGNLFADPPVSCVAPARRTPREQADRVFRVRVGTEVDPGRPTLEGRPVTRCGFALTGYADDPGSRTFRGVRYDQYVRVYLKPLGPPGGPSAA